MSPRYDEVRRLADLEKKATPGPWFQENCTYQWDLYAVNHDLEPSPAHPWKLISANKNGYYPPESDAELIPSIRNAAPWLLEAAGCFQPGDGNLMGELISVMDAYFGEYYRPHKAAMHRLLQAAKIMEERE